MRIRLLFLFGLVLVGVLGARGEEMTPAVTLEELDAARCAVFCDGRELGPAPMEALAVLLALKSPTNWRIPEWSTGVIGGKDRHFRIAFTRPISLGTICTTYVGRAAATRFQQSYGVSVSYLKATAPGDVFDEAQWITLPPGEIKLLPPGTTTRALRFSDRAPAADARNTRMGMAALFTERYYSALALGHGKRVGAEKKPEIWTGYWDDPQTVVGLVLLPQRTDRGQVEILRATSTEHPLLAPAKDWKALPALTTAPGPKVVRFASPLATRGLRLTAPSWRREGGFGTVLPLVNLGERTEIPSLLLPAPPFRFPYTMPMDGFAAIDIHDKDGKRVRRLIAETPRDKGPVNEPWDLKDDRGQVVPPGEYSWKAITRPPFKNTYQLTVNHSGQPAWPAPAPGKGGGYWLGDHSTPFCAAALGDTVWLGCQVCEGGHSLIATDLEGNKRWGEAAVSWGFSGPERIAVDGRYAYLVNNEIVQRVDPQNSYKTQTIYTFTHTREFPGNGGHWDQYNGGAAALGDKLYVAYNGKAVSWLQPPFKAEDINPKQCMPMVWLERGGGKRYERNDKVYGEASYDEIMRLYAALFTEVMPAVTPSLHYCAIPSSTQAYLGDADEVGALAGTITVIFKKPITLGSVLLPDSKAQVYALRTGKPVPKAEEETGAITDVDLGLGGDPEEAEVDPFREDTWLPLSTQAAPGRPAIALAPEGGVVTQALRFKAKRVTFALAMARRFEDVAPQAERVYVDGAATPQGGWTVTRDWQKAPITPITPALMGLVWAEPPVLRGISLVNPSTASMAVDLWTGPAEADPKAALTDDTQWRQVGLLEAQIFNGYFSQQATARHVDFGENLPVRAIRIRAIYPEGARYREFTNAVKKPHQVGFGAVVVYRHLGHDPETPPEMSARIDEFQLPQGEETQAKFLRHLPLPKPGNLAVNGQGVLHAVSDGKVVTVPLTEGETAKVVVPAGQVEKPAGMAFDADGLLYVVDGGPQVVKVLDPKDGRLVRTIGTPGGATLGPWDPARMDSPAGITIDSAGKLWVTNRSYQPKLVTRWSRDGKVEKWFMGPTGYGGGGWMDPQDRAVVLYNGMKFVIDWQTKTWKLDSRLYRQGMTASQHTTKPDRVVYLQGRRYLVGDPGRQDYDEITPVAVICREQDGVAIPLVSAGNLGAWDDAMERPELRKAFGTLQLHEYGFVWIDGNADGLPQPAEVQLTSANPLVGGWKGTRVGDDLSLNFKGARLRPTGISPAGVPQYDLTKLEPLPLLDNDSWTTADGRTFVLADRLLAKDGKTVTWAYDDDFLGGHGFHRSGFGYNRPAGVLNGEHTTIGHFTLKGAAGTEEEYFLTNSDQGDWFVFTGDGMLAGCIFGGPAGYGQRWWSMPEWEPGKVDLSDVRLHQEHYKGSVTKSSDGKVYAIAGKDWNGVVLVEGLEQLTRLSGKFTVTQNDLEKTQQWSVRKAALEQTRQEAKVAKVPYLEAPVGVDGSVDEWPDELFVTIHDYWKFGLGLQELITHSQAAFAYDADKLYVAVRAIDTGALKNSAQELKTLFKYGGAVDLQLAFDPKADPKRTGAAPGDMRILLTQVKREPLAVLYNFRVPGAPAEQGAHYKSPVGEANVDVVQQLADAEVMVQTGGEKWAYMLEAAIPWKALGVEAPAVGTQLRGDIGLLMSDQNGMRTVDRLYWAGKSQKIVSDVPSEARIAPALWGTLYFSEPEKAMHFGPEEVDILEGPMLGW